VQRLGFFDRNLVAITFRNQIPEIRSLFGYQPEGVKPDFLMVGCGGSVQEGEESPVGERVRASQVLPLRAREPGLDRCEPLVFLPALGYDNHKRHWGSANHMPDD